MTTGVGRNEHAAGAKTRGLLSVKMWGVAVVLLSLTVPTEAQRRTAGGATGSAQQAIDQLYEAATKARKVGEIVQALSECDKLLAQPLDPENKQYLAELKAWLLNRRGEAYALAATRSADAGTDDEAMRQEQLARQDFRESLQLNKTWRAHHNLGVSLAMLGEYAAALTQFQHAIDLNPDYPNTRFNRAELWLEMGQFADAEREYSEVLRLTPNDVDSKMGRGHARFYLSQFEAAMEDFDSAIEADPKNAVAFADRADLNAFLGHWKEAAVDYRQAISLDRELGRAWQSAAWLMATCPNENFREADMAVKAAKRAIELDGAGDYRYLDTLAAAQANAAQFAEANVSLQEALQVAPEEVQGELRNRMTLYQAQRPYRDQR